MGTRWVITRLAGQLAQVKLISAVVGEMRASLRSKFSHEHQVECRYDSLELVAFKGGRFMLQAEDRRFFCHTP